jgi:hypothetical protein
MFVHKLINMTNKEDNKYADIIGFIVVTYIISSLIAVGYMTYHH